MFSIGKTKIKFNFTFFAVIALLIFIDTSGAATLSLIASLIHESGHLLAMILCKAELQSIVFYGGGICITSDKNMLCFSKRLFILSAGCLMNIVLAFIGFFFFCDNDTFLVFSMVNLIICIFNLMPIGYFDGAEILDVVSVRFLSLNKSEMLKRVVSIAFATAIVLAIIAYCFILDGDISLSFLFVVLYLIIAQFVC